MHTNSTLACRRVGHDNLRLRHKLCKNLVRTKVQTRIDTMNLKLHKFRKSPIISRGMESVPWFHSTWKISNIDFMRLYHKFGFCCTIPLWIHHIFAFNWVGEGLTLKKHSQRWCITNSPKSEFRQQIKKCSKEYFFRLSLCYM